MSLDNHSLKRPNIIRSIFVALIYVVILIPRIPIIPVGYGELAIRADGVASAFVGLLAIFVLRKKLLIISLLALFLLYIHETTSVFLSVGLFFQVISILLIPRLLEYFSRQDIDFYVSFRSRFVKIIIGYALINIIIASFSRYLSFEFCADSSSNTGCFGPYGLLDRPYVFSVFIGVAFVLVCAQTRFSFVKALLLLFGLMISDSRAISALMFMLGTIVYFKLQRVSLKKMLSFIVVAGILLAAVTLGEGKMSINNTSSNEIDPSWLMRLNNIDLYFEWVDFFKSVWGGGALAFYQFSDAYGQPGPVDNLYIRVASEIGIIGGLILIYLYLYPILRYAFNCHRMLIFIAYTVAVASISLFQESLIVPRAGHVLVLLGVFICCVIEKRQSTLSQLTKHV